MKTNAVRTAGRWIVAATLVAAIGCSEGTSSPGAASVSASVAGLWDWTAVRTDTQDQLVCSDTGSFRLTQTGTAFTGMSERVGSCTSSLGPYSYHQVDSVTNGTAAADGERVVFNIATLSTGAPYCSDTLVFGGASGASLQGNGTCGSQRVTWSAQREGPVGSVTVTPGATLSVVGTAVQLAADLHSALGAPVFLRSITWTSNTPAVATVTPSGAVTAVGGGNATITAATSAGVQGNATITALASTGLTMVGAGNAGTCALDGNGNALCWGLIPGPANSTPTPITSGLHFTSLTVGHDFACALAAGGAAYCWGANESGQLGNGSTVKSTSPVAVGGNITFASLSAGGHHVCGVTSGGAAWCWGSDSLGQLGNGSTNGSLVPILVAGGLSFASVTSGGTHSCARTIAGVAYCWGDNQWGAVGDGTTTQRLAPVPVAGAQTFSSLSAGQLYTCGVAPGGGAFCWGRNWGGQLGIDTTADAHVPTAVSGGLSFTSVSAGDNSSCGIATNGAAWCWGTNNWGQLGTGAPGNALAPAPVAGALRFASLTVGLYEYSDESINEGTAAQACGVTTGGTAYCWGVNNVGQLGNGLTLSSMAPVKVVGQP